MVTRLPGVRLSKCFATLILLYRSIIALFVRDGLSTSIWYDTTPRSDPTQLHSPATYSFNPNQGARISNPLRLDTIEIPTRGRKSLRAKAEFGLFTDALSLGGGPDVCKLAWAMAKRSLSV